MRKNPFLLMLLLLCAVSTSVRATFPSVAPFTLTSCTPSGGATVATSTNGIAVTFPTGVTSKITWSAGSGSWDWSAAAQMAVVLTNTGTNPAPLVHLVIDKAGKQMKAGVLSTSSDATYIPPGTTQTVLIDLTLATANDPINAYGMATPPPVLTGTNVSMADRANVGSTAPNYTQVGTYSMQITNQSGSPITLNIQSILLYKPSPISSLYDSIVDDYGQFTQGSWTNKITSPSDFATRKSAEDADLSAHPGVSARDTYGAWTSGGTFTSSSAFFHTQNINGKWWLVAPNGHLFLSLGINHIFPSSQGTLAYQHSSDGNSGNTTITQTRENMFPQPLPTDVHAYIITIASTRFPSGTYSTYDYYGANVDRKYSPAGGYGTGSCSAPWAARTVQRLKSWGFNTVANFSDVAIFQPMQQVPYVVYFHTAANTSINGIPDPYDSSFTPNTSTQAGTYMLPAYVNDPWCLGYICDNERSWGNYPASSDYLTNLPLRYVVAIKTLAADSSHPAKVAFQSQMQTKYGTITALNSAWGTSFASWTAFLSPYTVPSSPNTALQTDMGSFTTAFASTYSQQVNAIIKSRDPNHLYLGSRISVCSPEALQGLAQWQDVMSFNIYAPTLDPTAFAFTSTLGKPCMITEFSFGALDSGMFGYGYTSQRSSNQTDRSNRFSDYVESVLSLPAFVGVHWFEYSNQPLTGRGIPDGENYNFGFVDVADTPYQPMVDAARLINDQAYNIHLGILGIPALMEAEYTDVVDSYTVAGGGWNDIADPTLSNAAGTQLNATANNDYFTFQTPAVVNAGTYDVRIGIKTGPALGKFRLYVGDTGTTSGLVVGPMPTDEYSATASSTITEVDLGNWTTYTSTTKWFKFNIVNKNSHSSGNTLIIDYIKLQ